MRRAFGLGAILSLIAKVAFATTIFLTSGTSWTVPADWNSQQNTIELVGKGGLGSDCGFTSSFGGGGGGYSKISNFSAAPGASIAISFTNNSGGLNGFVSFGSGPSVKAAYGQDYQKVCSFGGAALGGQASAGIGTTKFSGGNGGLGTGGGNGTGSGGGAAGPNGNGVTPVTDSGIGGNADAGFGGAGGNANSGSGNGGNGTEWDASHGSGGGGATDGAGFGGNGGNYGGGGAYQTLSGPALIVIQYVPRNRVSTSVF